MANAVRVRGSGEFELAAASTRSGGDLIQLPNGEAAYLDSAEPLASGAYGTFSAGDKVTATKNSSTVMLPGQEVFWDRSAGELVCRKVNDRDFRAGVVSKDAAAAAVTCELDLNKPGRYDIDLQRDYFLSALVGTVGYNAMGVFARGGGAKLILSSTNEAQKVDLLSRDGFAPGAKWIAEFLFTVPSVGSGSAPDFSIGVASGTHATDADSIAESALIHMNGNDVNLYAESDDGTTEVAATDTTVDVTAGSAVANRVHVLIDGRDLEDVRFYINGARVSSGSTFKLDAATGPLFLLAHLEKTAATDTFEVDVERMRVWFSEQ